MKISNLIIIRCQLSSTKHPLCKKRFTACPLKQKAISILQISSCETTLIEIDIQFQQNIFNFFVLHQYICLTCVILMITVLLMKKNECRLFETW